MKNKNSLQERYIANLFQHSQKLKNAKKIKGDSNFIKQEVILIQAKKFVKTQEEINKENSRQKQANIERLKKKKLEMERQLKEQEEKRKKEEEERRIAEELRRKQKEEEERRIAERQRQEEEEKRRKEEEQRRIQEELLAIEKEKERIRNLPYHFKKYNNPIIKIEDGSGTEDKDLYDLVNLMNIDPSKSNGFSQVVNEKGMNIYKKHVDNSPVVLIKSIATIPFKKEIVFEAISNLKIRRQWDKVFSELKVVDNEGAETGEILYMIIKAPLMFENRDFVQRKKVWKGFPDNNSIIMHFVSVEHPKYPKNKKYTRAETVISGYYIKDKGDGTSLLGIISQTDIKGNIPSGIVNKFAPSSSKDWIKSLQKGCKMLTGGGGK
ncbi:MAG: START domain-containing protein [archaeon]|nr:START domain-containing protein [archaeon]